MKELEGTGIGLEKEKFRKSTIIFSISVLNGYKRYNQDQGVYFSGRSILAQFKKGFLSKHHRNGTGCWDMRPLLS